MQSWGIKDPSLAYLESTDEERSLTKLVSLGLGEGGMNLQGECEAGTTVKYYPSSRVINPLF